MKLSEILMVVWLRATKKKGTSYWLGWNNQDRSIYELFKKEKKNKATCNI